jgi:DNA-binding transcriptional regulator YiaG
MPNIATLLKSEISRLSRKEIRKEVQPLRKAAAAHRREIASLKRTIASLDRRAKALARGSNAPARTDAATDQKPTRFVAKGLVSLRKRLALSAPQLAQVLQVSTQSIYNWETKKSSPRKEQVAAIAALRSVGKKEVQERLAAASRPAKRATKKRTRSRA